MRNKRSAGNPVNGIVSFNFIDTLRIAKAQDRVAALGGSALTLSIISANAVRETHHSPRKRQKKGKVDASRK